METKGNFQIQRNVALVSLALFLVKFFAWYLTSSVAILTDSLESIVNLLAGAIGLFSIYLSMKPRDLDHPYGHGKVEFISAGIEGTMISIAGILILYKSVKTLIYPVELNSLDSGMFLIGATSIVNFFTGRVCINYGKKTSSPALLASGKHLQSDAWSTVGIIIGLLLVYFTDLLWIDGLTALVFGLLLFRTGYLIIRSSVAGIMDEADQELIEKLVKILEANRNENWIDIHNLRIIKYGPVLHIDCHLTLPWYQDLREAHKEVEKVSALVKKELGNSLELFIHTDPCLPFSCSICQKQQCQARQASFEKRIPWTLESLVPDRKHKI